MRRVSQIMAAFAVVILFVTSCDKELNLDVKTVSIKSEQVIAHQSSAEISGKYEFPSVLKGIDVYVSKNENLSNVKTFSAKVTDHDFSVDIDNLTGNTKYFYCYEFNNGMDKARSDVRSFETEPYEDAAINTDTEPVSVKATTAVCGGTIIGTAGFGVIQYGVTYTRNPNATPSPSSIESFTHTVNVAVDDISNIPFHFCQEQLEDLLPNTTYYYWAYFISAKDYKPVYGQREQFTTKEGKIDLNLNIQQPELGKALCNYDIYTDFSSPISEHGICWSSEYENPTLDHCEGNLSGVGSYEQGFSATMLGLTAGKKYYVCAYATNEIKTWYSEVKNFTALTGRPVFSGFKVIKKTYASATLCGTVTNGGDNSIHIDNWVFLWSTTNHYPDIMDYEGRIQPSEWGETLMNGLVPEQIYYVRPYVEYNGDRHEYGDRMVFKTPKKGGLTGAFTINDSGDKVCFSQGNLQYIGSAGHWKLAENQWECLGNNGQGSTSQTADRDLFGWGTSGNMHGAVAYYPWATVMNYTMYYAYGQPDNNLYNFSGEADWGHNRIYINEYNTIHADDGWHTLTNSEWIRLVNGCKWDGRFSPGSIVINGISYRGHFLLPDDWTNPESITFTPDALDWTTNTYNEDQWVDMEAAGAVFLPAAGYREDVMVGHHNSVGYYWSSSIFGEESAWRMKFDKTGFGKDPVYRFRGFSVRLVHNL